MCGHCVWHANTSLTVKKPPHHHTHTPTPTSQSERSPVSRPPREFPLCLMQISHVLKAYLFHLIILDLQFGTWGSLCPVCGGGEDAPLSRSAHVGKSLGINTRCLLEFLTWGGGFLCICWVTIRV